MTAYINSMLVMLVLCMLITRIAPEDSKTKNNLRLVCSLVILLTMITPIKSLISSASDIGESLSNFFTPNNVQETEGHDYSAAAATLISYIADTYPDAGNEITVTFVTDDEGRITEAQFFLPLASTELCGRIERELGRELTVTVRVFGEGVI